MANTKTDTIVPLLSFLGGEQVVGELRTADALETRLRNGLPFRALERLMESAQLSREQAVKLFGVAPRTFVRRKNTGTLTFEEANRVVQFADLFAFAAHVFGKREGAARWLQMPNPYLGGLAPIDRLDNALGRKAVLEELNRIAYGMLA